MNKIIWIFGLIGGVLSALVEYLYFANDAAPASQTFIVSLTKIAVLAIAIVFGLVLLRKHLGGTISISRTMFSGVMISLVRAIVLIAAFAYLSYPKGEFYEHKKAVALQVANDKFQADTAITEEKRIEFIKRAQEEITSQFTVAGYAKVSVLGSILSGFIISLLTAVFIARNKLLN